MSVDEQPQSASRRVIAGMLLLVPLALGVGAAAATNTDIASTWTSTDQAQGAPSTSLNLTELRRTVGNANSQASMLQSGTKQLVDGTAKLSTGTDELAGGVRQAHSGSEELADGMNQLQAATGQLGQGATKVADGVELAVGQIVGIEAMRGQILTAIEDAQQDAAQSQDPKAKELQQRLEEFRKRVETAQIDESTRGQLEELRKGSREVANQLAVPGYGYHDGIYSATKGSKELAGGLSKLADATGEAQNGVKQLDDGAKKIDAMAKDNATNLGKVQRALPVAQPGTAAAEEAGVHTSLAPMYAFLIAAGVMLAASRRVRDRAVAMVGAAALAVLGGVLVAVLGFGVGVAQAVFAAGVCLLAALVAGAGTAALVRLLGRRWGVITAMLGLVVQVGVVGWIWNLAAAAPVSTALEVLAALMPLNYPTMALSAIGNVGVTAAILPAAVMCLLLGACAAVLRLVPAPAVAEA